MLNLQHTVMMKRRTFLYNVTLGTLGFGFFPGNFSRFSRNPFADSLEAFLQAIGARAQNWRTGDSFLNEAFAKAIIPWKKTGYTPLRNDFYLCQKDQTAISILQLTHKELGVLDVSAVIFRRDVSVEKWKLVASLSGFQLEALVKAAEALQSGNGPGRLAKLLLPSPKMAKRVFGGFHTELGEVVVSASMGKDKIVKIKAAVYEDSQARWSAEYPSLYLQSL